jgi:hypothetical protein
MVVDGGDGELANYLHDDGGKQDAQMKRIKRRKQAARK